MERIYYGFIFIVILTVVLVIYYNYSGVSSTFVNAQTACIDPPVDASGNRWQKGANVTVKIHSAFTDAERNSIIAAFEEWNNKRSLTCSDVKFSGFEILDAQPAAQPNTQWVGFDPNTTDNAAITFLNSGYLCQNLS